MLAPGEEEEAAAEVVAAVVVVVVVAAAVEWGVLATAIASLAAVDPGT